MIYIRQGEKPLSFKIANVLVVLIAEALSGMSKYIITKSTISNTIQILITLDLLQLLSRAKLLYKKASP